MSKQNLIQNARNIILFSEANNGLHFLYFVISAEKEREGGGREGGMWEGLGAWSYRIQLGMDLHMEILLSSIEKYVWILIFNRTKGGKKKCTHVRGTWSPCCTMGKKSK